MRNSDGFDLVADDDIDPDGDGDDIAIDGDSPLRSNPASAESGESRPDVSQGSDGVSGADVGIGIGIRIAMQEDAELEAAEAREIAEGGGDGGGSGSSGQRGSQDERHARGGRQRHDAARQTQQLHSNPLTALTGSQLNLLGNTTGTFRGPGDVYARFLMGGRSIRIGARRALAAALHATEIGAMDEFLIDKNLGRSNASKNPRAIERLRKKYKETLKQRMIQKVQTLEETRVYKEENTRLRDQYERVVADINKRVSETLTKNEESDHHIKKLQREKALQRQRLAKEYAVFIQQCERNLQEYETKFQNAKKAYESQADELIALREFKTMTFLDPEVIAKRIAAEYELKDHLIAEQTRILRQYEEKIRAEENEAEQTVVDRIMEIIDKAKTQLSNFINKATTTAYRENKRLKSEIQLQLKHQELLAQQIKAIRERRTQLLAERSKHVDDRRRVLNLKACMSCTPDMDPTISPSRMAAIAAPSPPTLRDRIPVAIS
nr:hypothetical protein HK105_008309 [Polyrhizophydium stewartii]